MANPELRALTEDERKVINRLLQIHFIYETFAEPSEVKALRQLQPTGIMQVGEDKHWRLDVPRLLAAIRIPAAPPSTAMSPPGGRALCLATVAAQQAESLHQIAKLLRAQLAGEAVEELEAAAVEIEEIEAEKLPRGSVPEERFDATG